MIKLLDLCCKAGGASMGYYLGAKDQGLDIHITGVDIEPQPRYPFTFVQADALQYVKDNYKWFSHIHASPPCQNYSCITQMHKNAGHVYSDLLKDFLNFFATIYKPVVIENVMPAPIRPDLVLRGDLFGLKLLKQRKFQFENFFMLKPQLPKKRGSVKNGDFATVVGNGQSGVNGVRTKIPGETVNQMWSYAMGIDWMNNHELAEAIPPPYTRYISQYFFNV